MAKNGHTDNQSLTCRTDEKAAGKGTSVKRGSAASCLSQSADAEKFKSAAKEADRTAKRKAMTLRVFNDIYDSHHKAR